MLQTCHCYCWIESHAPDVVVSTYPGINPVLGRLRQRGRLSACVCTTVLDLASLEFWAHRGIDLHLVMHGSTARVDELAGPWRSSRRGARSGCPKVGGSCS